MHGLGNDFVVFDAVNQTVPVSKDFIKQIGDRHTGIGFDQCLLVEPSHDSSIDFYYRIFNADGSEVGQCGNGARCLARFIQRQGLSQKEHLTVATKSTLLKLRLNSDETVTVDMGRPQFSPSNIPLLSPKEENDYSIELQNQRITFHALSLGNPHAVIDVSEVSAAPVETIGSQLSHHSVFPEQANVGFMQRISDSHIKLRVFERGCGETKACGSGAVAAAAIGHRFYSMASEITLSLPGGDLLISWPDVQGSIYMTGPAVFVYDGTLTI